MRFSIEQIFLTDSTGEPLSKQAAAFHVVQAESLDAALILFIAQQQASLVGNFQRLPGARVVATAQQGRTVFGIDVTYASDAYSRPSREAESAPVETNLRE